MRIRIHLGTVMIAVAATTACDSSTDPTAAVEKLAAAICETTARCCSPGEFGFLLGPYTDPTTCKDRVARALEAGAGSPFSLAPVDDGALSLTDLEAAALAAHAGRVAVNSSALDECLAHLEAASCPAYVEPEEDIGFCDNLDDDPADPPAEADTDGPPCDLDEIFSGTLGNGEVCTIPGSAVECKDGLICRPLGTNIGLCVAPGKAGEFCVTDAGCVSELYCSQLDGTCRRPSTEGQACAYADPENPQPGTQIIECAPGLDCDPVAELCVATCRRGASCFDDNQCDTTAGLACVDNRCSPVRELGQACTSTDDCANGLRCGRDPRAPANLVCIERLPVGEPCDTFEQDQCASDFCDPATNTCTMPSPAGSLCPSGLSTQCVDSYCETSTSFCTADTDCPGSGVCNIDQSRCEYYCVGLLPEGTTCSRAEQCQSQACVDGLCRTLPLDRGQPCSFGGQCESGFCAPDTGVCDELPLAEGRACSFNSMCESEICFGGICVAGIEAGEVCGGAGTLPCAAGLFCDGELIPPRCTAVKTAGEACEDGECRGDCVSRFSRNVCDLTPAPETVICDGN